MAFRPDHADPATARYPECASGAPALIGLLGGQLVDMAVAEPGTTVIHLGDGSSIAVYDSETRYESYQIHIGDRLIVL